MQSLLSCINSFHNTIFERGLPTLGLEKGLRQQSFTHSKQAVLNDKSVTQNPITGMWCLYTKFQYQEKKLSSSLICGGRVFISNNEHMTPNIPNNLDVHQF